MVFGALNAYVRFLVAHKEQHTIKILLFSIFLLKIKDMYTILVTLLINFSIKSLIRGSQEESYENQLPEIVV